MNADTIKEVGLQEESIEEETDNLFLAEKLDFLDIQILRKFYMTDNPFPFDTQPYCFPILFKEMKQNHQIKIGLEAFRKRLDNLTRLNLILKLGKSNPTNYMPIRGLEQKIRSVITRFFIINGLTKFI